MARAELLQGKLSRRKRNKMAFEDVIGYGFVFGIMFLVGIGLLGGWFNSAITVAQTYNDPKTQLVLAFGVPALIIALIYGWGARLEPGVR